MDVLQFGKCKSRSQPFLQLWPIFWTTAVRHDVCRMTNPIGLTIRRYQHGPPPPSSAS